MRTLSAALVLVLSMLGGPARAAESPALEEALVAEGSEALARAARAEGDPRRGAILFHQSRLGCARCHATGEPASDAPGLGPDLARLDRADASDAFLVESVLFPSRSIRKGFEPVTIATVDGRSITGLVVEDGLERVVLRDAAELGKTITLRRDEVEMRSTGTTSLMPAGQVAQLTGRQEFLDLVRYLIEIRDGGPPRAAALKPTAAELAVVLPDYESHVDHAGMVAAFDNKSLKRGEAIYNRLCINCHGTLTQLGSLPTSLRFGAGRFKNGSDPYAMYQTLTRGFGLMTPQTWMVPQQKYDVIHYIRETYLKKPNPSQYARIDARYLAGLPKGNTRGPKPKVVEPWVTMDYGPSLVNTYEVGDDGRNFAYKGIAVRVDDGPGGVARGRAWMVFDHDTLRLAAAWTGEGFIDWNGIHFNGLHQIHPRIVGDVHLANPTGPGWADPETGRFDDDRRVRGRDGRAYGPLPRSWGRFRGVYHHGPREVIAYSVGATEVLESPGRAPAGSSTAFTRTFRIGPRARDMVLQVAHYPSDRARIGRIDRQGQSVTFGNAAPNEDGGAALTFDGTTSVDVAGPEAFDLTGSDYTITAAVELKPGQGGTIFAKLAPGAKWTPDSKALFVRGGRLCFDIGWAGAVRSKRKVDDGRKHEVAATWDKASGMLRLFVDGRVDGEGVLRPRGGEAGHVVRLGVAAPDFPSPASHFTGRLDDVWFHATAVAPAEGTRDRPLARWRLDTAKGGRVVDAAEGGHDGTVKRAGVAHSPSWLVAGLAPAVAGAEWLDAGDGNLRLRISAGDAPLMFTLWTARTTTHEDADPVARSVRIDDPGLDLERLTHGGPPRWPQTVATDPLIGRDDGPFAVDGLTTPETNPWLAQVRPSGLDFLAGGDRVVVSTWDGDVWLVSGLSGLPARGNGASGRLTWRRIASGLFQPLGVKVVNGAIHVTCRDELAILRDFNGDDEADFIECFNSDHQVTEHFHEFAMGLQVDAEGNFYYAKSARHALPALVPHHGTLLKVSPDGMRTDIVATGFRAANGVCLNPDGTFFVTDQEGHWTPKNRINLVKPGGFYGNMFGYHGVTDSSDAAMEPPVCWITNEFDRSPGELLWVDSRAWGPLRGALLNLSYGQGKIYVVLRDTVSGRVQGGVSPLPIATFPTGVMRGRFHPRDGGLYACGLYAWAGNQQHPGGFYRVRATGKPMRLPVALHARPHALAIGFTDPLDPKAAADPGRVAIKTWSLRRTANYGSQHYDERPLAVAASRLDDDGRTLIVDLPDLMPTQCMEIRYALKGADGAAVDGVIHNTIHALPHE